MELQDYTRVGIPVSLLEFDKGGNTIWVQSPEGGTVLRINCTGNISVESCSTSPISHSDAIVNGDVHFCLSSDAIIYLSDDAVV